MRTRPDPPNEFFRGDAFSRHVLAKPPGDNAPECQYGVAAETLRLEKLIEGRPPVAEIPELRSWQYIHHRLFRHHGDMQLLRIC
jgi:hypothetical protein